MYVKNCGFGVRIQDEVKSGMMISEKEKQEYLAYKTPQDCVANLEHGVSELENLDLTKYEGMRLICGGMMAFDKGISDFLNDWNRKSGDLFLLSEVTAQYRRYTREKIEFPFLCTPHLLAKEMVIRGMPLQTTATMKLLALRRPYISRAARNMEEKYGNLGKGYALVWSWHAYRYCRTLLKKLRPKEVILWNEFYSFHQIVKGCCEELAIPISYMEFGCLPGTLCVEKSGQQGESLIARKAQTFLSLPVTGDEIRKARRVLAYLKATGLNRNEQPKKKVRMKDFQWWNPEKKTILFLGQNDYESGMCPYTADSKRYHSPVFSSTMEALEYLRKLSARQGWNLIYKPHPLVETVRLRKNSDMRYVNTITDVDVNNLIDHVDLVVTILSQGAYIALIRGKPVLMLGYSQLKGKGCTYEAFARKTIETAAEEALKHGYTKEQQYHFEQHAAQLLRYYLYDDLCKRPLRFGKEIGLWKGNKEDATTYSNGASAQATS